VASHAEAPANVGPLSFKIMPTAIVACDFFVSVTASFRILYVFIAMVLGLRRILHCSVTQHPTAEWTIQQFREFLGFDHSYRYIIYDRDTIFWSGLDATLKNFGVRVLKTPVRAPKANAFCERLIGTIRRECLDFLIPLGEGHLERILREWVGHYNRGRPHSSLGPGIPEPPRAQVPARVHGHKLPASCRVTSTLVLGGLHHEYVWRMKPHDAGLNFCGPPPLFGSHIRP
jgi:hypothetical protein